VVKAHQEEQLCPAFDAENKESHRQISSSLTNIGTGGAVKNNASSRFAGVTFRAGKLIAPPVPN
jgi:hypothetical protein